MGEATFLVQTAVLLGVRLPALLLCLDLQEGLMKVPGDHAIAVGVGLPGLEHM